MIHRSIARRARLALGGAALLASASLGGCNARSTLPVPVPQAAFLDTVQRRTFDWFWETTNPQNGLTPDRWPTRSFSSVAAVGFALTAYPIGVERGWISREEARQRVLTTLEFFRDAPRGPQGTGVTGHQGFYYHFLDMNTGLRFETVELSTIDTALLLAGALFCREYFDRAEPGDSTVRAIADTLYARANWQWAQDGELTVSMGWRPDAAPHQNERGFIVSDWRGYNEGMLLYVLALASPTFPVPPEAWTEWTRTYRWDRFHGQEFVQFAPLFGHQYSHLWIDFRGIQDEYMRGRGIDYFENSRRATLSQRAYAIANPGGWRDYGASIWGLTASDGPFDGTIEPTAAGGSVPFAPEVAIPALAAMRERYGDDLFGRYGFLDAFNPTLRTPGPRLQHGRIVEGKGWFDTDYLGIDQGPILAMIENHRSDLVWKTMRKSPHIARGLCRAGFRGGWLAGRCN